MAFIFYVEISVLLFDCGKLNKLHGKALTQSEKLKWQIILMVNCVTILHSKNIAKFFRLCNCFYIGFYIIIEKSNARGWLLACFFAKIVINLLILSASPLCEG